MVRGFWQNKVYSFFTPFGQRGDTDINYQPRVEYFKDGLNKAKNLLESSIKEIDKYWQEIDIKATNEDVIDIKPNFMGLGLNINALIKKFFKKK
jgi:hypothetical protein